MQVKTYFPCVSAVTDLCVKEVQRSKKPPTLIQE